MKRILIAALAATTALTATMASAQSWDERRYYGDRYDHRYERPYSYDRGDRYDRQRYDRYRRYYRGDRFDNYRNDRYVVYDYERYRLRPPPYGYRYYRTERGDIVLAAVATGVITSIIINELFN